MDNLITITFLVAKSKFHRKREEKERELMDKANKLFNHEKGK